jgi:hypothetical protein
MNASMPVPIPGLPPEGAPPTPSPQPSNTIFGRAVGIRAGWRIAIYLALATVVTFLLILIIALFARERNLRVTQITQLGTGLRKQRFSSSPLFPP